MKTKLYIGVANITKAISAISSKTASLTNDIQRCALSVLNHYREHGDWTVMVKLVEGISITNGTNKKALKQYLSAFGIGSFVDVEGVLEFVPDVEIKRDQIDLDKAEVVRWDNFKPANGGAKGKDLAEMLAAFAKSAKTSLKKGFVDQEAIDAITAVFNEQIERIERIEAESAELDGITEVKGDQLDTALADALKSKVEQLKEKTERKAA